MFRDSPQTGTVRPQGPLVRNIRSPATQCSAVATTQDPLTPWKAHGIVGQLRAVVRTVLLETGSASAETADASAEVVFAVFYLALCDATTAHHGSEQLLERIDGLLATHFHDWGATALPPPPRPCTPPTP